MYRRYRMGYAGAAFGRLMSFLCPMALLLQGITVAIGLQGGFGKFMSLGLVCTVIASALLALVLLVIGPWPNRLAGAWLGIVSVVTWLLIQPAQGWAMSIGRYF